MTDAMPHHVQGAAVVAMAGKDCVAIACDKRFGCGAQMISTDGKKIFQLKPKLFVGIAGLDSDVQTVVQKLQCEINLYELTERREMKPRTAMHVLSNILYTQRFAPYYLSGLVVAGMDSANEPFVAKLDCLGCCTETDRFGVVGSAREKLYGMCESVWVPNMSRDELFENISQALLNAVDRDTLSGMGATVYVITKDEVTSKIVRARMD